MKKQILLAFVATAAALAAAGAMRGIELAGKAGATVEGGRIVAAQACATNASGTVKVKRVTTLATEWWETATVTNVTWRPAASNVEYRAEETLWRAWTTNAIAGGGVASNLLGMAWNVKPIVAGWPSNEVLYTSAIVTNTLTSNVTYRVVDTRSVETVRTRRRDERAWTNVVWSAALSGGWAATNGLDAAVFPGDVLVGDGGKVMLLIER